MLQLTAIGHLYATGKPRKRIISYRKKSPNCLSFVRKTILTTGTKISTSIISEKAVILVIAVRLFFATAKSAAQKGL